MSITHVGVSIDKIKSCITWVSILSPSHMKRIAKEWQTAHCEKIAMFSLNCFKMDDGTQLWSIEMLIYNAATSELTPLNMFNFTSYASMRYFLSKTLPTGLPFFVNTTDTVGGWNTPVWLDAVRQMANSIPSVALVYQELVALKVISDE